MFATQVFMVSQYACFTAELQPICSLYTCTFRETEATKVNENDFQVSMGALTIGQHARVFLVHVKHFRSKHFRRPSKAV